LIELVRLVLKNPQLKEVYQKKSYKLRPNYCLVISKSISEIYIIKTDLFTPETCITYQKNQWVAKNRLSTWESEEGGRGRGPPWYGGQQPWVQHPWLQPSQNLADTCKNRTFWWAAIISFFYFTKNNDSNFKWKSL